MIAEPFHEEKIPSNFRQKKTFKPQRQGLKECMMASASIQPAARKI
jgi:hypothetical protein